MVRRAVRTRRSLWQADVFSPRLSLLAAQVIAECDGDYRCENLQPYVDRLEARFGQREPAPGLLDKLPAGFRQAAARLLMRNHWFSRNILTTRWFLHAQDQPLPPRVKIH